MYDLGIFAIYLIFLLNFPEIYDLRKYFKEIDAEMIVLDTSWIRNETIFLAILSILSYGSIIIVNLIINQEILNFLFVPEFSLYTINLHFIIFLLSNIQLRLENIEKNFHKIEEFKISFLKLENICNKFNRQFATIFAIIFGKF
jgi:hypothetical protein